jgi:hypothetical protein
MGGFRSRQPHSNAYLEIELDGSISNPPRQGRQTPASGPEASPSGTRSLRQDLSIAQLTGTGVSFTVVEVPPRS